MHKEDATATGFGTAANVAAAARQSVHAADERVSRLVGGD